jgi:hypothetical protein
MAAEAATQQTVEEVERLTVLRTVKAFQERKIALAQRLVEAARVPSLPRRLC